MLERAIGPASMLSEDDLPHSLLLPMKTRRATHGGGCGHTFGFPTRRTSFCCFLLIFYHIAAKNFLQKAPTKHAFRFSSYMIESQKETPLSDLVPKKPAYNPRKVKDGKATVDFPL